MEQSRRLDRTRKKVIFERIGQDVSFKQETHSEKQHLEELRLK